MSSGLFRHPPENQRCHLSANFYRPAAGANNNGADIAGSVGHCIAQPQAVLNPAFDPKTDCLGAAVTALTAAGNWPSLTA